jgi:hypothetical protein
MFFLGITPTQPNPNLHEYFTLLGDIVTCPIPWVLHINASIWSIIRNDADDSNDYLTVGTISMHNSICCCEVDIFKQIMSCSVLNLFALVYLLTQLYGSFAFASLLRFEKWELYVSCLHLLVYILFILFVCILCENSIRVQLWVVAKLLDSFLELANPTGMCPKSDGYGYKYEFRLRTSLLTGK